MLIQKKFGIALMPLQHQWQFHTHEGNLNYKKYMTIQGIILNGI